MSILLGYDPVTLRERVDLAAVGERLDELGAMRSMSALCERTWLLKVAGRLDEALDVANQAVRLARFAADRHDLVEPRILRAQVLTYLGKGDEAVAECSACAEECRTHEWEALEAVCLQHRGKAYFELGDLKSARDDFRRAAAIRERLEAPADQVESSRIALDVVDGMLAGRDAPGPVRGAGLA